MIKSCPRGLAIALVLAGACSASCGGSDSTSGSGGGSGTTTTTSSLSGPSVELSYTPGWPGVTSVVVIGDFGAAGAWDPKQPFLTLADDGTGTWRGTASVPEGEHAFLFAVNGDAEAPADTSRYVLDPLRSKVIPCPAGSPTFSESKVRPCSALTVPEPAKDTALHVTGKVTSAGAAAPGWRVELHREEDGQDHVLTNGADTGADGAFDVAVAAGKYRVYVLHPTFYSLDDTQRDPHQLKALRRAYSSVTDVAADTALDDCEVSFDFYDLFTPSGLVSLPATLSFALAADAKDGRAAVYGTKGGSGTRVYDPWFASDYGSATSVSFDGTFNTSAADEATAASGEAYFWGAWQRRSAGKGGLWNGQSMVFPIQFQ